MALGPLISGSGWWWLCAFIAAGTLFSGLGFRAIRTPPSLVPVLELVVLLLMLTLLFGGATSFALIVPTQGTFETFGELFVGAQRTIEQQSVPAIPVPALSFGLALGVGLLAVLTDILVQTLRMPALAAAPALVPILIPGFIIEAGAELPTLVLTAAAYLLLLRIDVRVRRRASARGPRARATRPPPSSPRSGCRSPRRSARRWDSRPSDCSPPRCSPPRRRASRRASCSARPGRARCSRGA